MNKIIKEGWDADRNGKKWEDYDTIKCLDGEVIDMQALLVEQDRAVAALNHLAPSWGGLISKLKFVYTFGVRTQATDGYFLFVNPQFTYHLDFTAKVFVMAHEVMHCLLNHMRRGRGHDHERSNVAADYEVNASLVEIDFVKVATIAKIGALYDKKYTDWSYEKIYDDGSMPIPSSQSQSNKQSGQGQSGQGQGQSGQGQSGAGGAGGSSQQHSADYKAGWAQAIEDYKKGKIKI